MDRAEGGVLASLETGGYGASAADEPRPTAAVDDGVRGTGVLPLAVLAAGLVLVSIGLAVGAARARGAGEWHRRARTPTARSRAPESGGPG